MKKLLFTLLTIAFTFSQSISQQATYDVTPGNGNGLRFWSNNSYKIHMGNSSEYKYGPVTDYSIKMNMSSTTGRGWTWGQSGVAPIAGLSNTGEFQIASTFTANKMLLNDPNTLTDWNLIWQSGFFEGYQKLNAPDQSQWYWGINFGHTSNHSSYRYGGQILIKNASTNPTMYFRSRNNVGDGIWAKVLHNYGSQNIAGILTANELKVNNGDNSYGSILALANESSFQLYTKTITTQPVNVESFRIGLKYNSDEQNGFISFYRGGGTSGGFLGFATNGIERVRISSTGNLGIGTTNPTEKLVVDGKILAEEVKVQNVPASDYVFESDYNLRPIKEVEAFVKENKHLPDIPSAEEFKENGVGLGEMDNMLLRKVEELTLYVIELQKKYDDLENKYGVISNK